MKIRTVNAQTRVGADSFTKKLVYVICGLLIVYISIQFLKLATIGRVGAEISRVKSQQEQISVENELLRSEISNLKSYPKIKESIEKDKRLQPVALVVIYPDSATSSSTTMGMANIP